MSTALPMRSDLRAASEEARHLIQEAAAISARTESALDAGDTEEVIILLHERSLVLERSEAALAVLRKATTPPDGYPTDEARSLIAEVVSSARELQPGDARLAIALASERDRVGRELDQVEADEAMRSAYGKQTRERAKINIVR